MAAPSISTYNLSNSSHYYGSEGGAAVMTSPSDSVTKVSAIISQTSGGAAIETVDTTVKTSSDQFADRWALTWPTAGITASPYYVRMWATNSDGDGAVREVAPYIYFPPSVSVTSPADGSTLTDSSVTMAWTAADDYGISYQRVSVSHGGTELWGAEVEGNSIAVPSSVVFENGESYSFSVMARNGKGMEATATNTASFSFVAPSVPALVIAEGDGKSASITVTDSSYTESGTVLEASSAMMESLTIHGLSVQDGTPTPSAPVEIKSVGLENLLDISTYQVGVYSINADGSLHVTGADGRVWASATKNTPHLPNGVYYWESDVPVRIQLGTTYVIYNGNGTSGMFALGISAGAQLAVKIMAATGTSYPFDANVSLTRTPLQEPVQMGATAVQLRSAGLNMLPNGKDGSFTNAATKVTVTRTDGVYTFAGTSESTGGRLDAVYSQNCCRVPAGTYRATAFYSGTGALTMHVHKVTTSTELVAATNQVSAVTSTPAFTVNEGDSLFIGFNVAENNTAYNATVRVMLTRGADAPTAYTAYDGTTTPIPVKLRSLPDGTHDEWVSGESADTLVQRVGETMQAVTDGVTGTVGVDVLSSTGEIANGAQVLYKLATPVTTTLAHVNLPYVDGSAWVDAEVTPQIEATFRPVDFPDQPAADSVDVVRVNADGSTWTVASNLTMGDTVTDPLPPLGVDAVYKAVGKTSAGGMSEKLYMHGIPSTGWVLNFGDAAQETVGFIYNPQATMTLAQGGESYHFADGGMGGGLPVFYPTTDRDASGTLAFDTVLYGDSDRLLDLCRRYPVAWLRDPFGHRWRAHVRPSVSHGVGQVWPVTIAWDAVRFEEV